MFPELTGSERYRVLGGLGLGAGVICGLVAALLLVYYRAFATLQGLSFERMSQALAALNTATAEHAIYTGLAVLVICAAGGFGLAAVKPDTTYGAARFGTTKEAIRQNYAARLEKGAQTDAEIIWGKFGRPRAANALYLKTGVEPHGFFTAPTGAGKGVGFVIPNLLHFNGSVICLDVSGENFEKTAVHRQKAGDRIIRFAPGDPERSHCYNPMAEIAGMEDLDQRYEEIAALADTFITSTSSSAAWIEGCKSMFIATAMLAAQRGDATIALVHDMLIAATTEDFALYASECTYALASNTLRGFAGEEPKTLKIYIAILRDHGLGAWGRPSVRRVTNRNDFSLSDLRRIPTTIYVDCPESMIVRNAPLIRLLFQQLSNVLHRSTPGPDEPFKVLFLLDEFASLGKMDVIVNAYATIRKHGGRIIIVTQNMARLFDIYGVNAVKSFVADAGTRMVAATADLELAEMICKTVGDRTHKSVSVSRQSSGGLDLFGGKSRNTRAEGIRLVKPEDITNLDDTKLLVIRKNLTPLLIDKIRYFEDAYFQPIFEAQAGTPLPYPIEPAPTVNASLITRSPTSAQQPDEASTTTREGEDMSEEALAATLADSESLSDPVLPPRMRKVRSVLKQGTAQDQVAEAKL